MGGLQYCQNWHLLLYLNFKMKKSRRSRSSRANSPHNSHRRTMQPASVRGLVTNRQQNFKTASESQVSNYTQKTQKSYGSASQDFDFVDDDLEREDMKEVFVSEEEEKVIQKILQVARKGKINQKNAFQIPLKVIDNENFSLGQTKFWKFAAELLGASMNIYEKRIENTWINTNMIHDKLARMATGRQKNQQNDENEEGVNRQEEPEFLMMSIEEFRDSKILDSVRIGEQTLDEPQKINIINLKKQFTDEPLFHKKLRAFDNTSLKGLLLNVFDISGSCEIELFCSENKLLLKQVSHMIKNQYELPAQQQFLAQAIEATTSILKQRSSLFNSISQFKSKNIPKAEEGQQNLQDSVGFVRDADQAQKQPMVEEFQAFMQQPFEPLQSQMPVSDDFLYDQLSQQIKTTFEDNQTLTNQFQSQSQGKFSYMSQRQEYSPLTYVSDEFYSDSALEKSFHSVMTPWELEFKQGKLRKKTVKKGSKKQGKKKQRIEPCVIEFDALKVESKKVTLKVVKQSKSKGVSKKRYRGQNLIPPQLAVYEKLNFKKATQVKINLQPVPNKQPRPDLPDFLAPDPSMLEIEPNFDKDQNTSANFNQIPEQIFGIGEEELAGRNLIQGPLNGIPPRYNNIRETKKLIYEKTKEERQLRISEVDLQSLSPASLLITFLHIANEKNMIVKNTAQEDDIILSWD